VTRYAFRPGSHSHVITVQDAREGAAGLPSLLNELVRETRLARLRGDTDRAWLLFETWRREGARQLDAMRVELERVS
jgi:hypothetical protein